MPDILLRLEAEHVAIQRPWASWLDLARSAMQVIEVNRKAAQSKDLPVQEPKPASEEAVAATPVLAQSQNKKKTNVEKAEIKKTVITKKLTKPASKPNTKKSAVTISKKLDKKTSGAKQSLTVKKVVASKKAQSTNPSTNSIAKKIGRKK